MALILLKWLFIIILSTGVSNKSHPIYVSVTEIEHNAKEKTLEVSCKIFTDDFEQTLRKLTDKRIDLLNPMLKAEMNEIVRDYVQKHLRLNADGRNVKLNFIGFEQQEEGITSFLQADNITKIKELSITDNILYEYKSEQISIIHVTVNGNRKSTKLNNPEDKAIFTF